MHKQLKVHQHDLEGDVVMYHVTETLVRSVSLYRESLPKFKND